MLDRRVLARAYFTHERLVKHQIDSFNRFLDEGLQRVIDEQKVIELDIPDTYVKLGRVFVGKPIVKEADGTRKLLLPAEARLRNLTYSAPIYLETTVVDEGKELEPEIVEIGMLPIMLKSKVCNLHPDNIDEALKANRKIFDSDLSSMSYEDKLCLAGEDPLDPGGYFVVNGTERALVTLEDLAPNKILLEREEKYGEMVEVAKCFSQRAGYRALIVVERNRNNILEVTFPQLPKPIKFVTLMKALGVETDQEIVEMVSNNPEIVKYMLQNIEESDVDNQIEAIEYIGRRVAPGQSREYRIQRAEQVLDQYFLPHLGTDKSARRAKAFFLARMAEMVFELYLGLRMEDDKDHYANKRLKLAGDLMEEIFRAAFLRLIKDVKYQLERAKVRGRPLKMSTAVRSDVLTDRIMHPMATGNWVGGRTGVSQLIDRHNYMSVLSHLRRVVSPLSRSQPHFEARDLHPTQWGRICPSETPEGPNCGLVKNYAQYAEVSVGVSEDHVRDVLFKLGVEPIRGG